jgi:hypothetical protein
LAHDAWLFVIGVYCIRGDDELKALGLAREAWSTWRWVRHEDDNDLAGYSR